MSDAGFFSDPVVVWLVLGLILCAAETVMPGAFLIWIGVAAVLLGIVCYFVTLSLTTQLVLFALLVVALVAIGRRAYGSLDRRSPMQPLSRADALIGKAFYLDGPIEHGYGQLRVNDSVWRVAGADCPKGAKVRVVGVEAGALLKVEAAPD